jgi:hypothetical protein
MLQNNEVFDIGKGRVDETYPPLADIEQKNVSANAKIGVVFFQSQSLAYNWKTDQWTRVPALSGAASIYSLDTDEGIIGQVITSNNSFQLTDSSGKAPATATIVTGEFSLNPDGRAVVNGCRPITDGGSLGSITIGVRDLLSSAVASATGTAINTRTGSSNFRGGANKPEGRFHRAELIFTGGFTTISGAEFDFSPQGRV